MKNLFFLTLLFIGFTGFASPPVINTPTPLVVCDSLNDGFERFNLTFKIPEVLGALDPSLYSVTFHETLTDAEVGDNAVTFPFSYTNIVNPQTIFIRVQDITDGSYSTTSLDLILNPTPIIGTPQNLSIEQIPFIGTSVFDLTTNENELVNGLTGATVVYYTSLADAQNNTNQISNPNVFSGNNGQTIWARVELATTPCASFASFQLYITNPDIVFIPDANFKAKLTTANATNYFAQDSNGNSLIVDSNGNGEIEFSEALNVYQLYIDGANIISLTGIESFTNLKTLECSNNQINALNISTLTNLEILNFSNNSVPSLDVTNNTSLKELYFLNNQITSFTFTNLPLLTKLNIGGNDLTGAINFTGFPNLQELYCAYNNLTSINVLGLSQLIGIDCTSNQLTYIDVSGLSNLQYFYCNYNYNVTWNMLGLSSLKYFSCNHCNLYTASKPGRAGVIGVITISTSE